MKAISISETGTITEVEIDPQNSLDSMQGAVGGLIELLDLTDTMVMVINEEGKILGLPANDVATRLTQHYAVGLVPWDQINGPALLTGLRHGETTDVPLEAADTLARLGYPLTQKG